MEYDNEFVVGFDLDGVIIDHTQNKIRIAGRYGFTLRPEETHSERMGEFLPPEVYKEMREQMYDDTDEALSAPLMPGAFDGLARLREQEIPYVLISRRKTPIHAIHLLERRGLWGAYFTPENTFFVEHMEDKDPVAKRVGVTHFIDDERRVLRLMPSVQHHILFDARNLFDDTDEYQRVKDWSELAVALGISHA
jgi:5' nucleotidase, deoxy (Pyrimidine), cytosolic type C protein (NT5C)